MHNTKSTYYIQTFKIENYYSTTLLLTSEVILYDYNVQQYNVYIGMWELGGLGNKKEAKTM